MKTKTLFIALLATLGGALAANAQITTGEPTSKVIRTGNRAEKGDFGLYIGATTSMFNNIFKEEVDMVPLPLLNLKYMATDNFELRVGLEAYKLNERLNGNLRTEGNTYLPDNQKYGESTVMLYPGFSYHFSRLNILDVYVGAELPLGWETNNYKTVSTNYESQSTKRSFVIGLGAFVGLQAYIADLPLAIGVEYGISSRLDTGLKYKNTTTIDNQTTVAYSPSLADLPNIKPAGNAYEKLNARKGEIGGQLRLTLSYYFK